MTEVFSIDVPNAFTRLQRLSDRILTFLRLREERVTDMSVPMSQFGDFLVRVHIHTQINVQGTPLRFAPLSTQYARRKARIAPGMPILVLFGQMATGFSYDVDGTSVTVDNTQDYANYHMTGTRTMPARPYIQLEDDMLGYGMLSKFIDDYIEAGTR
jgi:phage gpG-like protein